MSDEAVDEFLAHYGVKGMQWGKRKSPEQARSDRIQKLQNKLNNPKGTDLVQEGIELRNWGIKKTFKNSTKKGLSTREMQRVGARRVSSSIILRGSTEVATILVGSAVGLSMVAGSPKTIAGAQAGAVLLAGTVGKQRIDQLRAVRHVEKYDKIRDELDTLKKGR